MSKQEHSRAASVNAAGAASVPDLETFLARSSAIELAQRSRMGAPVFTVISLIMLVGTPISKDFGWLVFLEAATLIFLGVIRVWFARRFDALYDRIGERAVVHFSFLAALQSLTLGILAGVVIWRYWATQEVVLTITLAAGCIAAGTSALSVRHSARGIFLACVLAPFGIAVLLVGGIAKALLIVGFLVLMAYLVQDGGRARQSYVQQLRDNYDSNLLKQWTTAEQSARRKMSADMNHLLRTPINSIVGMTSLLLDENLDSRSREIATVIRESGLSLLDLIEQSTDGIVTRQGVQSERSLFHLRESVRKVVDRYREPAELNGTHVQADLDGLPEVVSFFDDNYVEQVLINLLNNAVEHTVRGTVRVSAFCEPLENEVMRIEFAVSDSGSGLSEEDLKWIFESITSPQRISQTSLGQGLGLPMSKGLTELMGGEIWIESTEGQGTTVRFTIKVQVDSGDASWHSAQAIVGKQEKPFDEMLGELYPLNILVVEDHDINRRVLVQLLAKMGYSVHEAVDGPQAVADALTGVYDLIFMDLRMPEMGGIEATRWIREHCSQRQLYIAALTGEATEESRARCMAAGMDDFIAKPVQVEDIEKTVKDAYSRVGGKRDDDPEDA